MSSPKLTLEPIEDRESWREIVDSSPQGTLFSESFFLEATGRNHQLFGVKQGQEIKAGIALILSEDLRRCELDDLVIYGGVLFRLDHARQMVKRRHDEFQITEFVISQLAHLFETVEFQVPPAFSDMRPFLWFRYHEVPANKYTVALRYTSLVDISWLREYAGREQESPCFQQMETVRRYSVREAAKKGGTVVRADNGDTLVGYYKALMESQNDPQSSSKLANIKSVINALLREDRGRVYHAMNAAGTVVYSACYGWDSKRAYYLFGGGHPEVSEPWQGTLIHWEAFKDIAQTLAINEVDLEGVNSPQRGWFKLGFGGDLRPYYHVRCAGNHVRP
ncbi:MAG: GNAT family N-acetyltransferase [Terrimicrobiaceae bacterium]